MAAVTPLYSRNEAGTLPKLYRAPVYKLPCNLPGRYPHYVDRVADHVGGALLAFGASGHCAGSSLGPAYPMDYRGVRYTILTGIERNRWVVAIYPPGGDPIERVYTGPRHRAEKLARAIIDTWLKERHAQEP